MSLVLEATDEAGKVHTLELRAMLVERAGDDYAILRAEDAEPIRAFLDAAYPRATTPCQECGAPATRHAKVLGVDLEEDGTLGQVRSVDEAHWCEPCAPDYVENAPAISVEAVDGGA